MKQVTTQIDSLIASNEALMKSNKELREKIRILEKENKSLKNKKD